MLGLDSHDAADRGGVRRVRDAARDIARRAGIGDVRDEFEASREVSVCELLRPETVLLDPQVADRTDLVENTLHTVTHTLIEGLVIVLFVLGLLIYVMAKFNAKANPVPSRTTHNSLVEVAWTVIPIIILGVPIFDTGFAILRRVARRRVRKRPRQPGMNSPRCDRAGQGVEQIVGPGVFEWRYVEDLRGNPGLQQ